MLLIADSGSTKCDWLLVKDKKPFKRFSTMGFNPYFHNEAIISGTLRRKSVLVPYLKEIENTYFYGAGCSSPELNQIVKRALLSILPNSSVTVDHDLVAAAYATYQGKPGIACIIGTGSNSCYFDGKDIYEEVPALAYILGDEGSGSYYGKKLLTAYLYKTLPKNIQEALYERFHLTKDDIMENVYMKPHANVYLASFMRFVWEFREEEYFQQMIFEGMKHFMQTHICCYKNYQSIEAHFVGSIAHHFEDLLRRAAKELDVNVGVIDKKPINGLLRYHIHYLKAEVNT